MEAANGTVKSSLYHPQHLLVCSQYAGTGSSVYACAACELRVTGAGYRCQECDFNHESCFRNLPQSHSAADLHRHELTLTRLLDASHRCDLCGETSHRGRYLYRCTPCNYAVHPRCTKLLVDQQPQPQPDEPQEAQGERPRTNGTREFVLGCTRATLTTILVVDQIFGGNLAPVIDPLREAVDEIMQLKRCMGASLNNV